MEKEEIILKIKTLAYENVNKKIEEERKETEEKIKKDIEKVEETLKYIKNKMLFKDIGESYRPKYILVTEEVFFEDYNTEPKTTWCLKGIEICRNRSNNYEPFIKVNGEKYYDTTYAIDRYENNYRILESKLDNLISKFNEIQKDAEELEKQKSAIKGLLEAYQKVEVENSYQPEEKTF